MTDRHSFDILIVAGSDVILVVQGIEIPAHRNILSSRSPFFKVVVWVRSLRRFVLLL